MHGDPINELNNGVKLFYDTITEDETAMYSAEISIVTFGTKAKCEIEFSSLSLVPNPLYAMIWQSILTNTIQMLTEQTLK